MTLSTKGAVLGIDVGCSPTRKSGAACLLEWSDNKLSWRVERFRAVEPERTHVIVRVIGGRRLSAAAFDGPPRRGFDVVGRYRVAERMLTRRLQPLIGKPGQASAPVGKLLNEHANACVAAVLTTSQVQAAEHLRAIHETAVVEAFPSSFLGVLITDPGKLQARRGDRSDTFYQAVADEELTRLLTALLPGRIIDRPLSAATNHDDRAGIVCALTALGIAAGRYTAVGDSDGWIVLPPPEFVQPWARKLLLENASELSGEPLRFVC